MNPLSLIQQALAAVVIALLAFFGGWLWRGDCAKEVRATEAVSTAKAETKAETITWEVKLADVQIKQNFDAIDIRIDTLPPEQPLPPGCPARELDDAELGLWNASNQGRYSGVRPSGAHEAGPDAPRPDGEERAGGGG